MGTITHVANLDEQFDGDKIKRVELEQEYTITLQTINTANDAIQYQGVFKRATLIGCGNMLHNVEITALNKDCENLIQVLEIAANIAEDALKAPATFLQDLTVQLVYGYTEWIINIESNDI